MLNYEGFRHSYNSLAKKLFNTLNEERLEWWPAEGTLIGILRYGKNFENLPDFGPIGTDTDIDIFVRADTDDEWLNICTKVVEALQNVCFTHSSTSGTNVLNKCCIETDKFLILDHYPYFEKLHIDMHRYIVNEENNTASCTTHYTENSYPFQKWGGAVPYRGMIVSNDGYLVNGRFEDIIVPCAYDSIGLLSQWNRAEYEPSTLRLPIGGMYRANMGLFIMSEKTPQLSQRDKDHIYDLWKNLQAEGSICFVL